MLPISWEQDFGRSYSVYLIVIFLKISSAYFILIQKTKQNKKYTYPAQDRLSASQEEVSRTSLQPWGSLCQPVFQASLFRGSSKET